MKKYTIEVPITTIARVEVNADNENDAISLAIEGTKHELYGDYSPHQHSIESVYIADEYESYSVSPEDEVEVIEEELIY